MDLFKYFEKEEYAEEFMSGVVSMASLATYRDIEQKELIGDDRHDASEGSVVVVGGGVTSTKEFRNLIRVCCCSTQFDEALKRKFGEYVVRIVDADVFGSLLQTALEQTDFVQVRLEHQIVSYGDEPLSIHEYVFIGSQLFTKPQSYEGQHEYRYAFVEKDEPVLNDDGAARLNNPPRRSVQLSVNALRGLFERVC